MQKNQSYVLVAFLLLTINKSSKELIISKHLHIPLSRLKYLLELEKIQMLNLLSLEKIQILRIQMLRNFSIISIIFDLYIFLRYFFLKYRLEKENRRILYSGEEELVEEFIASKEMFFLEIFLSFMAISALKSKNFPLIKIVFALASIWGTYFFAPIIQVYASLFFSLVAASILAASILVKMLILLRSIIIQTSYNYFYLAVADKLIEHIFLLDKLKANKFRKIFYTLYFMLAALVLLTPIYAIRYHDKKLLIAIFVVWSINIISPFLFIIRFPQHLGKFIFIARPLFIMPILSISIYTGYQLEQERRAQRNLGRYF